MTRTQPSASPTTSRAWRAIAALMFSLVLAPVAMADEPTPPLRHPPLPAAPAAPPLKARPRCRTAADRRAG
jgi:biopolymer transport protein ExbB